MSKDSSLLIKCGDSESDSTGAAPTRFLESQSEIGELTVVADLHRSGLGGQGRCAQSGRWCLVSILRGRNHDKGRQNVGVPSGGCYWDGVPQVEKVGQSQTWRWRPHADGRILLQQICNALAGNEDTVRRWRFWPGRLVRERYSKLAVSGYSSVG